MRKRKLSLVITFADTQKAMDCEKKCKDGGMGERLIPLPGEIATGCGLAWKTSESEADIKRFFCENNIEASEYHYIWLLERYSDENK